MEEKLVTYKCPKCNAEVVTAESTISTTCAYCGRALVITEKFVGDTIPKYIVPFKVTKEKAVRMFSRLFEESERTPDEFKEKIEESIQGVYLPYWLYSCDMTTQMNCIGREVKSEINIDEYSISGTVIDKVEYMPEDAVKNINNWDLRKIEPFDYEQMQFFSPGYMAGFYAEAFEDNAEKFREKSERRARWAVDTHQPQKLFPYFKEVECIGKTTEIENWREEYALMPVWILHRHYRKKDYLFLINGQTGKITGYIPQSVKKERKRFCAIWLSLGSVMSIATLVSYLKTQTLFSAAFMIAFFFLLAFLITLVINTLFVTKNVVKHIGPPPDRIYKTRTEVRNEKIEKIN